jgi:multidrug transporter EmrE-like cation transporter
MDSHIVIWIIIASIVAVIPVYFIKKYNKTQNYLWIFLSMFFYFILIIAYSKLFVDKNIIIIYPIIKIISILLVIIFGYLFFNYRLNVRSGVGILFSIISIYLLASSI